MANSSKYNAEQFKHMNLNSAGIIFVYEGKDGNDTAMHFLGEEYEMTAKTQDEFLRVMRNLKTTFWMVKEKETELREKNDGIRCKYRSSTPAQILVNAKGNQRVKKYETDCSDFSKFGFFPTKKDLERSARDKKKYIHSSTIAMLEALNFRVEFPKAETEPAETAAKKVKTIAKTKKELAKETASKPTAPVTVQSNKGKGKGKSKKATADKPAETIVAAATPPAATPATTPVTTPEVAAKTTVEMAAA